MIESGQYGDRHNFGPAFGTNQAAASIELANKNAADSLIADTSNINGTPVFIFSGNRDTTYPPVMQEAQRDFYNNYGANVEFVSWDIGHDLPSVF